MLDGTNATPGAHELDRVSLAASPPCSSPAPPLRVASKLPLSITSLQILGQYTCHYYYADAPGKPPRQAPPAPPRLHTPPSPASVDYPVFNCNATFTPGSSTANVTWPGFAGTASDPEQPGTPNGPYTTIGSLTPTLSGPASINVNLTGNPAFLRVVHFSP